MFMTKECLAAAERQRIRELIDREVVPAVGCTEPVAVALAAARATELVRSVSDSVVTAVTARLSGNIIKNAMGVGIPGTGMTGLPIAIALGVVKGDSSRGLEIFADVNEREVRSARKDFVEAGLIKIEFDDQAEDILHIDVTVETADGHRGRAVISGGHDRFVENEVDGFRTAVGKDGTQEGVSADKAADPELTLRKVWTYAVGTPLEELEFIRETERLNRRASEMAINGGYGHQVGYTMLHNTHRSLFGDTAFTRILGRTAAACDARMGGASVAVMSNSGSGNQGIAATMPVVAFAEETGATDEQLTRALVLSHLTVIYIKQTLGRLSALCGCVVAATGSTAAMTFLMGGGYDRVAAAVKNMVANLTGMICDGAKPSCALKLASGVSTAVLSALMAIEDRTVTPLEGIIDEDVDRTITNLTTLGRDGMTQTDRMILQIMTGK